MRKRYYPKTNKWKWIDNDDFPLKIVGYKDHLAEVAKLKAENERLKARLEILGQEVE